jgi:hypothetical protein
MMCVGVTGQGGKSCMYSSTLAHFLLFVSCGSIFEFDLSRFPTIFTAFYHVHIG